MRKSMTVVAAVALAFTFALPSGQAKPFDGGSGDVACGDGAVHFSPAKLWPPNHTLRDVTITYDEASDDGDTLTLTVDSITHNEEGSEKGSTANHEPDFTGVGNTDEGVDAAPPAAPDPATVGVELNAERLSKPKDGRIYTITVTCSDSGDLVPGGSQASFDVCVPHSRKRDCVATTTS